MKNIDPIYYVVIFSITVLLIGMILGAIFTIHHEAFKTTETQQEEIHRSSKEGIVPMQDTFEKEKEGIKFTSACLHNVTYTYYYENGIIKEDTHTWCDEGCTDPACAKEEHTINSTIIIESRAEQIDRLTAREVCEEKGYRLVLSVSHGEEMCYDGTNHFFPEAIKKQLIKED